MQTHGYYRIKDLMARGWYRIDIKRFLGNRPHRSIRKARGEPVKLYKIEIVHEIESSENFIHRPAAIAPTLFLEGYTLSRIRELLSITHSEAVNYTKDVRKSVRQGKLKRNRSQRKQKKQRGNKNITHLQKKGIVYFRMAGHSWTEVAHLVDLPPHVVQNFGRSRAFRELRQEAVMCLDNWFASKKHDVGSCPLQ